MFPPKKTLKILAIETSCDETACAVISSQKSDTGTKSENANYPYLKTNILSNVVASQADIHKKFGGVFPEIASRAHTECILAVVQEALENSKSEYRNPKPITNPNDQKFKTLEFEKLDIVSDLGFSASDLLSDIDVITVTTGPGLIGSLLVGVNAAKTLAYAAKKPILGVNHWLGHIYSCFAEENSKSEIRNPKQNINSNDPKFKTLEFEDLNIVSNLELSASDLPKFPLLALIVSGGHTGLVFMKSHTEYKQIGQTLDDAAGEAFDKVAKILGLPYPGGPAIAAAAAKLPTSNNQFPNIKFPRSMLNSGDFNFSFSGLKTAVLYKVRELTEIGQLTMENIAPVIAYEFQQTVIDILIGKTLKAAEEYKPKSIVLCGGVAANKELREQMREKVTRSLSNSVTFHTPPLSLAGDNAAMIGLAAAYQLSNGVKPTAFNKIGANSNQKI